MRTIEENTTKKEQGSANLFKIQIRQKNLHIKKRKVKTWTNDQDRLLMELCNQHPKKWAVISSLMKDRNQNQCLHRYRRLIHYGNQKKIWSHEEDQTISEMIKKVGKNWKVLSEILGTKTGKQIRQRFINKLDPNIKIEDWTNQEDRLILKYYSEFGSRWSQISKKLPGRPENKIKNRFYSFIQKNYDIKYIKISNEENEQNIQNQNTREKKQKQSKKENRKLLKQKKNENNQVCITNEIEILSIKQNDCHEAKDNYDLGELENDKDEELELNINFQNKFCLNSLIKVDEDLGEPNMSDQRYRSARSLVSHQELQNQNDFFYFSHL